MTVDVNDRLSGPHLGNGVTTAFEYNWFILANTELRVILRDEDGVDTVQSLSTDYSVSGVGTDVGGNVTFAVAPPTGSKVIIEGATPKSQTVNYLENERFPYASHQYGMDKIIRQIQELQRDGDRTPKFAHGETAVRYPLKPSTGLALLARNSSGEIVHADAADFGSGTPVQEDWLNIFGQSPDAILDNLNGIRFVATYAALTALTEATGLADNAIYCTYGRASEEDGGFGFWRYDAASSATANGGTVLAVDGGGVGRFFRVFSGGIDVLWFGAKGDGTTVDTTAIHNARDALVARGGGELLFRYTGAPYKANVVITGSNIHLRFEAPNFYTGSASTVGLKAATTTEPVLQFGDGTTTTRGCTVWNLALEGEHVADKGLYFYGADTITLYNFSARNFNTYQVQGTSSATKPTYFIEFYHPRILTGTAAGSLGMDFIYGPNFTNSIKVFGGALSAQAGGADPLQLSGAGLNVELNGTHIEGRNNQGINFATTGTMVRCSNVTVDSDSAADVLVKLPANGVVSDYLCGTVTVDGVASMPGGNTAALSGRYLMRYDSLFSFPSVQGNIVFQNQSANAWDRYEVALTNTYMGRTGNNLQIGAPGSVLVNLGVGGGLAAVAQNSRVRAVGDVGQEVEMTHRRASVSPSGATATATALIPAGMLVFGVAGRVTTAIGGATTFDVGDGTDVDRWGAAIPIALNTTFGIPNFTITEPKYYPAGGNVVLTANGSNFTSGVARIAVYGILITPPTS